MSFVNDTNVSLTAPNGATLALVLPDPGIIRNAFGPKITAYFGNQANEVAQIGQFSTFSRIQITGTPRAAAIDETFPGPSLNDHAAPVNWQWVVRAESPSGLSLPSSADGLGLRWSLPDAGYRLQFSTSLSSRNWNDLDLPGIATEGSSKTIRISRTALPVGATGFFRLSK
jgi:hypothetical protein